MTENEANEEPTPRARAAVIIGIAVTTILMILFFTSRASACPEYPTYDMEYQITSGPTALGTPYLRAPANTTVTLGVTNTLNMTLNASIMIANSTGYTISWTNWTLKECEKGMSTMRFTEHQTALVAINVPGQNMTSTMTIVNITTPDPIRETATLQAGECREITVFQNLTTIKNLTVCAGTQLNATTMTDLSKTLQDLLAWQQNQTRNETKPQNETYYYWKVNDQTEQLFNEIKAMKNCDTQLEQARKETSTYYLAAIAPLEAEKETLIKQVHNITGELESTRETYARSTQDVMNNLQACNGQLTIGLKQIQEKADQETNKTLYASAAIVIILALVTLEETMRKRGYRILR